MAVTEFDPPERFVAGTVGPPGQRTFFLQAVAGRSLVTVSVEKEHVLLLADRVNDLLDTVAGAAAVDTTPGPRDTDALATPIEDEFRVVALSLAWDDERDMVVIECHDRDPDEVVAQEELQQAGLPPETRTVRVVLSPGAARAFASRCRAVVVAGRPSCPFCGQAIDPDGHICPRANGYRR